MKQWLSYLLLSTWCVVALAQDGLTEADLDGATLQSLGNHLVAGEKREGAWKVSAESINTDAGEPTAVAPPMSDATASGCALRAQVSGNGPRDVVLLGGLSASPEEWRRTRDALPPDYRVHLMAVPGLGGASTRGDACPRDIESLASALERYIEDEIEGTPVVVGHSAGGLATLRVATRRPGLLSGIVVVDALPFMAENFGAKQVDEALRQRIEQDYVQMLSESPSAFARRMQEQASGSIGDADAATRIARLAAASDRATYASMYRSVLLSDLRDAPPPNSLPTFVILADQSPNGAPPEFMRARYAAQYRWLSKDHFFVIESSRHYVMLDQPLAFQRHLHDAMQRIARDAGT